METINAIFEIVVPFVEMTLGGIPVAVGVLLFVQLLGYVGLAKSGNQKRIATVATALVLSGLWASTEVTGGMVYAEWVALIYRAFIGAAVAALGYVKLVEPRLKGNKAQGAG